MGLAARDSRAGERCFGTRAQSLLWGTGTRALSALIHWFLQETTCLGLHILVFYHVPIALRVIELLRLYLPESDLVEGLGRGRRHSPYGVTGYARTRQGTEKDQARNPRPAPLERP